MSLWRFLFPARYSLRCPCGKFVGIVGDRWEMVARLEDAWGTRSLGGAERLAYRLGNPFYGHNDIEVYDRGAQYQ